MQVKNILYKKKLNSHKKSESSCLNASRIMLLLIFMFAHHVIALCLLASWIVVCNKIMKNERRSFQRWSSFLRFNFDVITIIASDFIPSDRFTLNYRNLMLCLLFHFLLCAVSTLPKQHKNTKKNKSFYKN
jgi:hypothetical protein